MQDAEDITHPEFLLLSKILSVCYLLLLIRFRITENVTADNFFVKGHWIQWVRHRLVLHGHLHSFLGSAGTKHACTYNIVDKTTHGKDKARMCQANGICQHCNL